MEREVTGGQEVLTPRIGAEQVRQAAEVLRKYRLGKQSLDRRIIDNEQFWKLRHWEQMEKGGEGGIALAKKVLKALEKENHFHVLYEDELSLQDKITKIAREIYGADSVNFAPAAAKQLKRLTELGFGNLPVCMAKNQYSLSDDPTLLGRPSGFELNVREAYVSAGAGFVVVLTGAVMTMPGLPKAPAAYNIDVDDNGKITGLF